MDNKSRLGRGLDAIFTTNNVDLNSLSKASPSETFIEIETEKILVNPLQPREDFDVEKLNELAESIKKNGIIQPLTIKPSKDKNSYELISGERRLRAAKIAGLKKVPAYIYVKPADSNEKMLELALIENVQRENLNPMELSNSYQKLVDECGLTQEQVAEKVSKQRSTVANFLRLQKLPDEIKASLRRNEISEAHARMLLRLEDKDEQLALWRRIINESISVKNLEEITKPFSRSKKKPQVQDAFLSDIENKMMNFFGTKVKVKSKTKNSGEIAIEYYSDDDLERILEKINQ